MQICMGSDYIVRKMIMNFLIYGFYYNGVFFYLKIDRLKVEFVYFF